jgi:hypothetical protein
LDWPPPGGSVRPPKYRLMVVLRDDVPAPFVFVDDERLFGVVTVVGHLGGYDLTIATTVGPLALDVQSSVLGHPATATAVAHLVRGPGVANVDLQLLEAGGLDGHVARAARLLDHYARVRAAVEQLTLGAVRIELPDVALAPATSP